MNAHTYIMIIALTTGVSAHAMEQSAGDVPKIGKAFTLIAPYTKIIAKHPPNIGVYGQGYPMLSRIARIQLAPEMINNWLPPYLARAVPAHVPDLTFDVEIDSAEPKTYNMVFHPWVATWEKTKTKQGFLNIQLSMGIFAANGVQRIGAGGITFDQLSAQNVHIHAGGGDSVAYSPNNARFAVSPQRDISSFWSVALSPNKQHGVITFHILANTHAVQDMIETALTSAKTLGDFLNSLEIGVGTLQRPTDQNTLQEAIQTIETTIGIPARITPTQTVDLQGALQTLTRSLTALEQKLQNG